MSTSSKSIELRILIWSLIFFVGLLFLVLLAMIFGLFNADSIDNFGNLGDALGGVTAPILGSLAIVVTFLAFWIQYEANQEIRKDIRFDRFENKFYELLRLHQYNVDSLEISGKFKGRKAFVKMYYEIRYLHFFIKRELEQWNNNEKPKIILEEGELMDLAYTIFFFGLNETRVNYFYLKDKIQSSFSAKVILELRKLVKSSIEGKTADSKFKLPKIDGVIWNPSYPPFQGHVSKLGHYYRHLYQLFKFICTNSTLENDREMKYSYVKIIRAQLSNHEQTLLYFNSFSKAGKIWWEETDPKLKNEKGEALSYFLDYGIIKNLPFNLTKFGPNPENEFIKGLLARGRTKDEINKEMNKLFEWIGG
jgi:hypothetical protein